MVREWHQIKSNCIEMMMDQHVHIGRINLFPLNVATTTKKNKWQAKTVQEIKTTCADRKVNAIMKRHLKIE